MTGFDLIEIFIALECLSFCSYILISLERSKKLSSISGIRYLIISALPSALLILGIIFLYKQNVSFNLTFIELTNTNDFMLGEDIINKSLIYNEPTF
jgi:NADH:ubiquinone oxidoreductase subunit 2 (subunit N)